MLRKKLHRDIRYVKDFFIIIFGIVLFCNVPLNTVETKNGRRYLQQTSIPVSFNIYLLIRINKQWIYIVYFINNYTLYSTVSKFLPISFLVLQ